MQVQMNIAGVMQVTDLIFINRIAGFQHRHSAFGSGRLVPRLSAFNFGLLRWTLGSLGEGRLNLGKTPYTTLVAEKLQLSRN